MHEQPVLDVSTPKIIISNSVKNKKASRHCEDNNVSYEILISDNGSSAGADDLARNAGARVVYASQRGDGAALLEGIRQAKGRFVIMGDSDDSYDFTALSPFLDQLRAGKDLVIGNRFKGGISSGAMPLLHRYVGNPVLTKLGQLFFHSDIGDFHCGLRGFDRQKMADVGLNCTGMEFASEMIVKASLADFTIGEVPTTLKKDGRDRPPHLRSWRDGWRHLSFMLLLAPRWLFFYPGLALVILSTVLLVALASGSLRIGGIELGVNTMVFSSVRLF